MAISDKWAREVYSNIANDDEYPNLTFCGALEVCRDEVYRYWKALETRRKYESSYENVIFPALENHDDKRISEYCKEDYENAIKKIREAGYIDNGIVRFYSESSMRNFEYLIYRVVFYASKKFYCENVLWGTRFSLEEIRESDKIESKVVLKKSLTPMQEKKLVKELFNTIDRPGEEVAILLMLGLGTRNAEACGLNYGDIKNLEIYPDDKVAWIYKSTIPNSSVLQSSGKTWNTGRIVPVPQKVVEFVERRRYILFEYLKQNELLETVNIDQLPIVCKGYMTEGDNYCKRASADDVTKAARKLFDKIGLSPMQLLFIESDLKENKLDNVVNEKDATAYLLRRNFATHLQIMGFNIAEIQYLIGHDVEDAYETRNEYVDEDRIHSMAEKLSYRPLLNNLDDICWGQEIRMNPKEEIRISVKSQEPLDVLSINVDTVGLNNKECSGIYYTDSYEKSYERTIDIIGQYHRAYKR